MHAADTATHIGHDAGTAIPWPQELAGRAHRYASRVAIVDADGEHSHADLYRGAAAIARSLLAAGVTPGLPVFTYLPNGFSTVCASYAILLAAGAETPLNAQYVEAELRYCVEVLKGRHVITTAEHAVTFTRLGLQVHLVDELLEAARAQQAPCSPDGFTAAPAHAWGRIVFTSGTTGAPKAIVASHANRWLANVLLRAHLPFRPRPDSRILLMTPFPFGAGILTYAFLDHGASAHLLDGVDPAKVQALLEHGGIDAMFAPPTVLHKIVESIDQKPYSGLTSIFSGTAALAPALYTRATGLFGHVIRITYGKSEIYNPITVLDADEAALAYAQSAAGTNVGWPASGVEVRVVDENGIDVVSGEVGEVLLRARHMMAGHVDAEGFHAHSPSSWHATGDMGFLGERGDLSLTGRRADMIKTGGYKVFAQEVENVLFAATNQTAIVVGVPSPYWGEVLVAVTEEHSGPLATQHQAAAEKLAKYKRPRAHVAVPHFPRGAQDKIRRGEVLKLVLERYRLVDGPHPRLEPI